MIWPTCQSLLAVLMMAMAVWAAGLPVVCRLRVLADDPAGRTLWALALGSLLWGFVLAGLAVLGLLYELLVAGLTGAACLAGWYQLFRLMEKYPHTPFSLTGFFHPAGWPKSKRAEQRWASQANSMSVGQKVGPRAPKRTPLGGGEPVGPAAAAVSQTMQPLPYEHAPPPDLVGPGGIPFWELPEQSAETQTPLDSPEPAWLAADWEPLPDPSLAEVEDPAAWKKLFSANWGHKVGPAGLCRRLDRPEGADRPEESGLVDLGPMGQGPAGWLEYLVWSVAAGAALTALLLALAPPTDPEALGYHLDLPKRWLQAHRLVSLPYRPGGLPLLAPMWFLWALALDGEVAAQLVHWLWGVMFGCSAGYLARLVLDRRWAWMAGALVLLVPGVLREMSVPHGDLAMATFCTLTLVACWQACRLGGPTSVPTPPGGQTEWWLLAGLAFGGAAGIARAAWLISPVLVGLALLGFWQCHNHRQHLVRGALVALGALAGATVPWYLLGFCFGGDPASALAPGVGNEHQAASSLQSGGGEHASSDAGFSAGHALPAWLGTPGSRLAAPWTRAIPSNPFGAGEKGIGLLWLVGLPGLLWTQRHRSIELLLSLAAGYFLVWTMWQPEARLLWPILPMLAPAVVWVWSQMGRVDRTPRWVAGLSMAICLLIPVVLPGRQLRSHLPVALGLETRQEFLYRSLPGYPAAALANLLLSPDAKILSEDERTFYFDPVVVPEGLYRHTSRYDQKVRTPAELVHRLRQDGFTHLLLVEEFTTSEPSENRSTQTGQDHGANRALPKHRPEGDVCANLSAPGPPQAILEGSICPTSTLSRLVEAALGMPESPLQELSQYRVSGPDGVVLRYRLIGLR